MATLPTREERAQLGRAARTRVPASMHRDWTPAADRPDPIALLEEQAKTRVPELVPIRYGRMAVSPFTFFRGAALPMAVDLAQTPVSGLTVQACGDAHLSNFGLFASPERDLLFDINDFDETLPGPWEWDLKRLAASLMVAGRQLGFDATANAHTVHAAVHSYRQRTAAFAEMSALEVFYSRVEVEAIASFVDKRARPFLESTVRSTAKHDSLHELPKLTEVDADGQRRIKEHPPILFHSEQMTEEAQNLGFAMYRDSLVTDRRVLFDRYQFVDWAVKVVGVGSVGLIAAVVLLDEGADEDPVFLQIKQAEASVLERFLGPSTYATSGERVVAGQRVLQAATDVMLGWTVGPAGRHFYIRQLQDQKGSAVIEAMTADDLVAWGRLCGWALARGHARSGDPVAIAGYLGDDNAVDHALADFAAAYADQNEKDHAALVSAIKSGRVTAATGSQVSS